MLFTMIGSMPTIGGRRDPLIPGATPWATMVASEQGEIAPTTPLAAFWKLRSVSVGPGGETVRLKGVLKVPTVAVTTTGPAVAPARTVTRLAEAARRDIRVGDLPVELLEDFFQAFASSAGANLHLKVARGRSNREIVEEFYLAALCRPPAEKELTARLMVSLNMAAAI